MSSLTGQIIQARQAKLVVRAESDKFWRETAREITLTALKNPVAVCLGLLAANRLAYTAGAYKPRPGERETSILGGPVWFQIGDALPIEQENYQKINAVIIGLSAGVAMGGLGGVEDIGKLVKAVN